MWCRPGGERGARPQSWWRAGQAGATSRAGGLGCPLPPPSCPAPVLSVAAQWLQYLAMMIIDNDTSKYSSTACSCSSLGGAEVLGDEGVLRPVYCMMHTDTAGAVYYSYCRCILLILVYSTTVSTVLYALRSGIQYTVYSTVY